MHKIVFTVTTDLVYDQRMQRICTSLTQAGYNCCLIGRELRHSPPLGSTAYRQHRFRNWFSKGKLFYLEHNARLLIWLFRNRWDAVCAVDLDTLLPAVVVCRWKKKICIYDAHEYFTELPELHGRPMTKHLWEWLAALLIPKAQLAYTVGEELAIELQRRYGTTFHVIRNLPQRKPQLPPPSSPTFLLIYQGALNSGRGLELAIEVVAGMDGVELWLCGEGDLSQLLRLRVRRLQVGHKIRFMGRVRPEELQALTSRADAGLNLLEHKGLNYYYSLANKCFDYIQAGIPSVNMDFPEYRRLNDVYGVFHLLPDLSADQLRTVLERWKIKGEDYQSLKKNCFDAADALHWAKEADNLIEIYRDVFAT